MRRETEQATVAQLQRMQKFKAPAHSLASALGPEMIQFFKQGVQKRQAKFAGVADCWSRLVPEMINQHCCLESFHRGTLTVIVDTASHLYELKQLLLAGLQKQLLTACRSAGLRKIALKRGAWYDGDEKYSKLRFQ